MMTRRFSIGHIVLLCTAVVMLVIMIIYFSRSQLTGSVTQTVLQQTPIMHGVLAHGETALLPVGTNGIFTCSDGPLPINMREISVYDLPQNSNIKIYEFTRSASGASFLAEKDASLPSDQRWPGRRYGFSGTNTFTTFLPSHTYYLKADAPLQFRCTQALFVDELNDISAMQSLATQLAEDIQDRAASFATVINFISTELSPLQQIAHESSAIHDEMMDDMLFAGFMPSHAIAAADMITITQQADLLMQYPRDVIALSGALTTLQADITAARQTAIDLQDEALAASTTGAALASLTQLETLARSFDMTYADPDTFAGRLNDVDQAHIDLTAALPAIPSGLTVERSLLDELIASTADSTLAIDLAQKIDDLHGLIGTSASGAINFRTDLDIDRDSYLSSIDYHYLRTLRLITLRGSGTVIHVDPYGDDRYSGFAAYAPVRTIARAQQIARGLSGNVIVLLNGGDYMDGPLPFDERDANTMYRAFPGEIPIFSGGIQIPK